MDKNKNWLNNFLNKITFSYKFCYRQSWWVYHIMPNTFIILSLIRLYHTIKAFILFNFSYNWALYFKKSIILRKKRSFSTAQGSQSNTMKWSQIIKNRKCPGTLSITSVFAYEAKMCNLTFPKITDFTSILTSLAWDWGLKIIHNVQSSSLILQNRSHNTPKANGDNITEITSWKLIFSGKKCYKSKILIRHRGNVSIKKVDGSKKT